MGAIPDVYPSVTPLKRTLLLLLDGVLVHSNDTESVDKHETNLY